MNICGKNFYKFLLVASAVVGMNAADAAQAPNPRAGATVSTARTDTRDVRRDATSTVSRAATTSRAATARSANTVSRSAANTITAAVGARSAVRQKTAVSRPDATTARAASSSVVRSATSAVAPSAAPRGAASVSRAGTARATAVFEDVSKIGGGYAACREAYSTCMDQFCAKANETYRRCFCSAKYTEFRDLENAMDEAKILLQRFEDNNLNAVDKTADEVNAMYTATVGEAAIKSDVSGATAMLTEITDLLSGKKRTQESGFSSTSLGLLSFDLNSDIDDIWGAGGTNSIFSNGNARDLTTLEGQQLYNEASKQCLQLVGDSCENNAVLTMATSSYSILISQDCNAYEKKVNTQKEAIMQTVRTAEKYLREARLDEYRAHNSADVNECIAKVRTAMTADTACGENYKRCMDYTGAYINSSTGEPIYSPRLFELNSLIQLGGVNSGMDVLQQNPQFNSFLESRKMFATSALDTCRDIAPTVWEEFKRAALIEISQAQDAKIEEVKMSCVSTMTECYDTQSAALKNFDKSTSQVAGALSIQAARQLCQDKVSACAALYGGGSNEACQFDRNGKITNANLCGAQALIKFVDTVDNVRIAEGCATAIDTYVKGLCTPTSGEIGFPWNCRTKKIGMLNDVADGKSTASLAANIRWFAEQNCADPATDSKLSQQVELQIEKSFNNIKSEMEMQFSDVCETLGGYWVESSATDIGGTELSAFKQLAYNGNSRPENSGRCMENSARVQCLDYNSDAITYATFNSATNECIFTDEWYKNKCQSIGGYYENSVCYVAE